MFEQNVPLKQLSHYKIGGDARYFFEAKNVDDLIKAIKKQRQLETPLFILAGATNVLINDKGFDGLILKIQNSKINPLTGGQNEIIKAEAGTLMSDLVNFAIENNLSGLEWASGLPGTLGGAIRGNAGAFGGEIKDVVEEVVSLDISQKIPKIIKRKAEDCDFEYRSSIFKKNPQKEIIVEATLKLRKGDKKEIEERTNQNINYRLSNHPMEYPSLGSTFKNVLISQINNNISINQLLNQRKSALIIKNDPLPVIPAAFLISEAGLKGISVGGAQISPKHPNFIVNVSNATGDDVENLIQIVKNEVRKKFEIELKEEIERI
ncbi:MAG: UDP-N-acetylmuramate dehydrogenase [Patescibacteria group bacterium]|nr:UDP-N-acetylmuramate dehydrogenase [Patescibacteria group bacterium]